MLLETSKRYQPSHLLENQYIGIDEVGGGIWDVYYSDGRFGRVDECILEVDLPGLNFLTIRSIKNRAEEAALEAEYASSLRPEADRG